MSVKRRDREREFFEVIEDPRPGNFDRGIILYHKLFQEYRPILLSIIASSSIVEETYERGLRGLHLLMHGGKLPADGGPPPARTDKLRVQNGLLGWLKIVAKDVRRTQRRRMSDTIEEDRGGTRGTGKKTRTRPFVFVPIEDERLFCDAPPGRFPETDSGVDWRWQRIEEALPLLSERGRLGTFVILCRAGLPGDLALDPAGVRGRAVLCGILSEDLDRRIDAEPLSEPLSAKTARLAPERIARLAHEQIARMLAISVATSRRLYVDAQAELRAAVARQIADDEAA